MQKRLDQVIDLTIGAGVTRHPTYTHVMMRFLYMQTHTPTRPIT